MRGKFWRKLSLILAVAMVFTSVDISAMAAENAQSNIVIEKASEELFEAGEAENFDGTDANDELFAAKESVTDNEQSSEEEMPDEQSSEEEMSNVQSSDEQTSDELISEEALSGEYVVSEEATYKLTYTVNSDGKSVKITGFTGTAEGKLIIPDEIDGMPVVAIGDYAFYCCSELIDTPKIPNSVTSIGNWAFGNCTGFTGNLSLPNALTEIQYGAFSNCSGFTGPLNIPSNVTSIGGSAFEGCSGFNEKLVLSQNLTSIGQYAFKDCYGFTGDLFIPESVTTIERWAFANTGFNGKLELSNNLTKISEYTFYCCKFNGNLKIEGSITEIGESAFYNCDGIEKLTIGSNVKKIGNDAFYIPTLTEVNVPGEALEYIGDNIVPVKDDIIYGCNPNSLFEYWLLNQKNPITTDYAYFINRDNASATLTKYKGSDTSNIVIPSKIGDYKVTVLGESVFSNRSDINGIISIPDTVTEIQSNAFLWCNNLTGTLTIPNSVKSIGEAAFYGCQGISTVIIPEGITTINDFTFYNCTCLNDVYIPDSVTSIGFNSFSYETAGCEYIIGANYHYNNGTYAQKWVLSGGTGIELETLYFNKSNILLYIGYELTLSKELIYSPYNAKGYINSLTWSSSNDAVATVDSNSTLKAISAGETIITAQVAGFSTSIKIVVCNTAQKADDYYYVVMPDGSATLVEYAGAINSSIEIPNKIDGHVVTGLGDYLFFNRSNLVGGLVIPDTVTTIGFNTFYGCSGLTGDLIIPDSVTDIGEGAFCVCGFDGKLSISKNITDIKTGTFASCTNLSGELVIPENVKAIGNSSFLNCKSLSGQLKIGKNVTSIGGSAFKGCAGFTGDVILPESITTIGYFAFAEMKGCRGEFVVPASVTSIGGNIVNNSNFMKVVNKSSVSLSFAENDEWYDSVSGERITSIANGTAVKEDVFKYKYTVSNNRIIIDGYTGLLEGDVTIPSEIDGYTVTDIAKDAFTGSGYWSGELILPDTLKVIGYSAFFGCGMSGKLVIPDSVTSIGLYAFYNLPNLEKLVNNSKVSIYMPKQQVWINDATGEVCTELGNGSFTRVRDKAAINIVFDANGGVITIDNTDKETYSLTKLVGDRFSLPPNPSNGTCIFDGWWTQITGGTRIDEDSVVQNSNSTQYVYAHWKMPVPESFTSLDEYGNTILTIEISTDDAMIIYTEDGSNPAYDGNGIVGEVYEGPITVGQGAYVKYIQVQDGYSNSDIESYKGPKFGIIWSSDILQQTYTGKAIIPEVEVYDGDKQLTINVDYTVRVTNNVNVGTAKVVVAGKGNYLFTINKEFSIAPQSITDSAFAAADIAVLSTGRAQMPKPVLTWNGRAVAATGYSYAYYNADESGEPTGTALTSVTEAGDYVIVITGKGNFAGTKNVKLTVTKAKLASKLTVMAIPAQPYTGEKIEPVLTVKDGRTVLTLNEDYSIKYDNNVAVGTASVIITGMGNYVGSKTVAFKIIGTPITKATVEGITTPVTYTGDAIEFDNLKLYIKATRITAMIPLTESSDGEIGDYTVSYLNNMKAGTATVVFTGINGYTGVLKKTFRIMPLKLADAKEGAVNVELEDDSVVYAKGGAKPAVTVTFTSKNNEEIVLTEKTDYTVAYLNNTAVNDGTGTKVPTVKVTLKGSITGVVNKNFKISAKGLNNLYGEALDKAYTKVKGNYKTTLSITDLDGKKLTANRDYYNSFIYTYKNETKVINGGVEVTRAANAQADANDIVPAGTVMKVHTMAKDGGNYSGSISVEYRVVTKLVAAARVTIPAQSYTGYAVEPAADQMTVKIGTTVLVAGKDFEVVEGSYTNNIKKGTASVVIRGLDNYGGTKKVTFVIKAKSN